MDLMLVFSFMIEKRFIYVVSFRYYKYETDFSPM